jgi:signal transduction histidine kinase
VWFARRFRLPRPAGSEGSAALPAAFLRHVEQALGAAPDAEELRNALKRFEVFAPAQQERELPSLYLRLEAGIAAATKAAPEAIRAEARRALARDFAPLLARPDFGLVFAPQGEQERRLCQRLLGEALAQAGHLLGAAGADFLRSLGDWIDAVPDATLPVPFELRSTIPTRDSEWVALFYRLARQLFLYLDNKLGESCARSFFERAYDEMARRYERLDTFPVVVHLLPERLLDSAKLGRLSQSQIQKVLLRKLGDLDEINTRLQNQYEELDATRHELVVARDQLERRVEERTAELRATNEQLRAAKEKAEFADRTKAEFLANMSHELRTPLNAIIGFAEVMGQALMGPLDAKYRDYASEIHGAGRHLLDIINDILDLSKIEAGRLELREETLELREVVAACRRVVSPRAETAGVTLSFDLRPGLPLVRADELRLKQIVLNVLTNAVKFTPAGGTVSLSAAADAAGGVVIAIRDTGIGMKPEDIAVALEPFRQIDSQLSRRYEGTGLGLPLVKRLSELHGGRLDIESAPGQGTTVSISLPAERVLGVAA